MDSSLGPGSRVFGFQPRYSEPQNLRFANFSGSDLRDANFTLADLYSANLSRANLAGAELWYANLQRANLDDANLSEVFFVSEYGGAADLTDATLRGAKLSTLKDGDKFIELAGVKGLFEIDFGDPTILSGYLADAFDYIHKRPKTSWMYHGEEREEEEIVAVKKRFNELQLMGLIPAELELRIYEEIQNLTAEVIRYLAKHPKSLYELHPRKFEELIAEVLASFGWRVHLTAPTRDGGYDIFAIGKDDLTGVHSSWLIECKRYRADRNVGIDIVRQLYGANLLLSKQAVNLMLATTSHFTSDVKQIKTSRYELALRDFEGVVEWLNEYKPNPNGKLYIKENRLIIPKFR